ncbi:hypothetical protein D3C80_2218930 [compost metagenome]
MQRLFEQLTGDRHQRRHGRQVSDANDLGGIDPVVKLPSAARYVQRAVHGLKSPGMRV